MLMRVARAISGDQVPNAHGHSSSGLEARTQPDSKPPPAVDAGSALAVLRSLAGLLQTGLLALRDASVAGQEACLLQCRTVEVLVNTVQLTGNAQTDRASLAGGATAVHANQHVVGPIELEHLEGLVHDLLVHLVGEVLVQRAVVDLPLTAAWDDAHAGDGLLATSGRGTRARGRRLAGLDHGGLGLAGVLGQFLLFAFDNICCVCNVCLDGGSGVSHGSPRSLCLYLSLIHISRAHETDSYLVCRLL